MDNDAVRYLVDAINAKNERTERRFFIVNLSLVAALILLTIIFIWYISLPVDEETSTTIEQSADDSDNSTQVIGGDYYGKADS